MKVEEAIVAAAEYADNRGPIWWHGNFLASLRENGWEIVPREPTEKMIADGEHAWMRRNLADPNSAPLPDCYRAMLAAAQENDDG